MASVTHLTNQSQFVQSNAVFYGTNASGTIASNGISVSVAPGGGGADGYNILAAGSQTANTTGSVLFNNANGITFGMSNSSVITASHNGLTTAMASNRGSDFVQATAAFAGTNATGTIASNGISVSVNPQTAFVFSNSNGVSFGTNGSTVTATVATNYQSQGAYLTTAAQSNQVVNSLNGSTGQISLNVGSSLSSSTNGSSITFGLASNITTALQSAGAYLTTARASNDAVGLNTAFTAGPLAWTVNSSGISLNAGSAAGTTSGFGGNLISGSMTHNTAGLNLSLNHPAWLTTAMQSNAATISNIKVSAGTLSTNRSDLTFANSNGISFGLETNGIITGTVKTDYQSSNANYLTSQSNQAFSASGGSSTFQTLNFANSNGITFSNSNGSVIASHNGLTTARASNDAVGLNTAGTNVTWTVNSSGLSFNGAGYAGTGTTFNGANLSGSMTVNSNGVQLSMSAAAPGGGGGIALANSQTTYTSGTAHLSVVGGAMTIASTTGQSFNFSVPATSSFVAVGALTLSTNGSTISISGNSVSAVPISFSAGTTSNSLSNVVFSNSNGISFGLNGSTMTAQHNALTTARASTDAIGLNTAGTNVTWTANSSGLSINAAGYAGTGTTFNGTNISGSITQNSNGLQLNLSAAAAGGAGTYSNWEVFPQGNNSTFSSLGQNSFYLQKMRPGGNYAFSNFDLRMSGSFVSSTNSQVAVHTVNYGLYSLNGATYSSIATSNMIISASFNSNTAMGYTISQGAGSFTTTSGGTAIASLMTGMKHLYLPFTSTITAGGAYAMGLHISSATTVGTSPHRMAILNQTVINNLTVGKVFASTILASNASFVGDFAQGVGSVTTGAMPSSIAETALTNAVSQARLYMQLD